MHAKIRPIRYRFRTFSAVSLRQASRHRTTTCSFHRNTTLVDLATIAFFSVVLSRHRCKAANMPAFVIRTITLSMTPRCRCSSRTFSHHREKLAATAACIMRLTTLCMTALRRSSSDRSCKALIKFECHKSSAKTAPRFCMRCTLRAINLRFRASSTVYSCHASMVRVTH